MFFILIIIGVLIWAMSHDAEATTSGKNNKPIALPISMVGVGMLGGPIGVVIMGVLAYAVYTAE